MTIDEALLRRVDSIAAETGEARSALIERLLREAVTEEELLLNPAVKESLSKTFASKSVMQTWSRILGNALTPDQKKTVTQKLMQLDKGANKG